MTVCADLLHSYTTKNMFVQLQAAGLSYIEYFSLSRAEEVTVEQAEDEVECQPDQIPKLGLKYFL